MNKAEPRWPVVATALAQVWFVAVFAQAAVQVETTWIRVGCVATAAFLAYRVTKAVAEIRRRSV